jgi:hypothetical protein
MMATEIQWLVAGGEGDVDFPEWIRSAGLSPDDGLVYVPAAMLGDDMELTVFLCAGYDGISTVEYSGHVYVPADWFARQYPDVAEVCRWIEASIREHYAGNAL